VQIGAEEMASCSPIEQEGRDARTPGGGGGPSGPARGLAEIAGGRTWPVLTGGKQARKRRQSYCGV
jgi:hypothetical protein